MGLEFAIDALYATDFRAGDAGPCKTHRDGREYPTLSAVRECFQRCGCELSVKHIQLFDCFRAEWHDALGAAQGAVVGQTEEEAAVYALSLMRKRQARLQPAT
jgi:hypothetical protein